MLLPGGGVGVSPPLPPDATDVGTARGAKRSGQHFFPSARAMEELRIRGSKAMLCTSVSITPHGRGEKGQTLGRPQGQTPGHQPPTGANPHLRLERLARRWGQDDVVAGLMELSALL